MDREKTQDYIAGHEGKEAKAYPDTEGIMTVGIGFNLEKPGAQERIEALELNFDDVFQGYTLLTDAQITALFDPDYQTACNEAAASVDNFWNHPDDAQMALTDMAYQLGGAGLREFHQMIAALDATPPDYMKAADEILDSKYAKQTPSRAADNVALVRGCAT